MYVCEVCEVCVCVCVCVCACVCVCEREVCVCVCVCVHVYAIIANLISQGHTVGREKVLGGLPSSHSTPSDSVDSPEYPVITKK